MTKASTSPALKIRTAELLSVIVPFYNEENLIATILPKMISKCEELDIAGFELIAIDDGSKDRTIEELHKIAETDDRIQLISFNRNFGKEAAIHAGLDHANGQIAFVLDGDGQHPFGLMSEMVSGWQSGADVVAACKSDRGKESLFTKIFASGFYALFKMLTKIDIKNMSDYVLLDRAVIDQYCALSERRRFFRGMIAWMGFKTEKVYFETEAREGGTTSWSRIKLFRFALNAITGFTSTPLHLISLLAMVYALGAVIIGGNSIYQKITGVGVTGFTTVNLLILITGALIMFGLGQVGIYIEQIFEELKKRPDYLINASKSKMTKRDNRS